MRTEREIRSSLLNWSAIERAGDEEFLEGLEPEERETMRRMAQEATFYASALRWVLNG